VAQKQRSCFSLVSRVLRVPRCCKPFFKVWHLCCAGQQDNEGIAAGQRCAGDWAFPPVLLCQRVTLIRSERLVDLQE